MKLRTVVGSLSKRKIVIASLLKPVDDTRMTEKVGMSLQRTSRFEVHIIGFPGDTNPFSDLIFHSLPRFGRLSVKRFLAPFTVLRRVLRIKPNVFVITTHELLITAVIAKIFTGVKVVYDVQENYYRNIRHTDTFPALTRVFLSAWVRLKEITTAVVVNHFLLAEKAYAKEFSFHRGRYTIVENKVLRPDGVLRYRQPPLTRLVFSGTMAESTGVFTAIEVAVKLHALDKSMSLLLIGHCPRNDVLEKMKSTIDPYPFIRLVAGSQPTPHWQILQAIQNADVGIIAYSDNPSTRNLMPTKLYEYMGYRLPILLIRNMMWEAACEASQAAIVFDPERFSATGVLNAFRQHSFYTEIPKDVFWESEEGKLLECFDKLAG